MAIGIRLSPGQLASLDAWIADQPEPRPGRPEVMRVALAAYLRSKGYLPSEGAEAAPDPPRGPSVGRYADADPEEGVMVTGVGPMTLRRAVRKQTDWRENHGLGLVNIYRGADKEPSMFDMADLSRLAEMERFR